MHSISPDRYEQDVFPVHLVQRLQVIDGGDQAGQARPLARWILRDGKLVCHWNVKK
ncbi:MAG: hypothetical protein AB4040_05615 [Synechococcus sp.]